MRFVSRERCAKLSQYVKKRSAFYGTSKRSLEVNLAKSCPSKSLRHTRKFKRKRMVCKAANCISRALDFLLETGLVHKLDSINAYIGRSHPREHNGCYFLICTDCNEAKECCSPELTDAIELAWNKNSFRPKKITLEVLGQCGQCE